MKQFPSQYEAHSHIFLSMYAYIFESIGENTLSTFVYIAHGEGGVSI